MDGKKSGWGNLIKVVDLGFTRPWAVVGWAAMRAYRHFLGWATFLAGRGHQVRPKYSLRAVVVHLTADLWHTTNGFSHCLLLSTVTPWPGGSDHW